MALNQNQLLNHTLSQFVWQVSLQAVTKFGKINSSLNIPAWCVQQPTLIKVGQGLRDVTRWVGFIFFSEFGFRLENSLQLSLRLPILTPNGIQFILQWLGNDLDSLASHPSRPSGAPWVFLSGCQHLLTQEHLRFLQMLNFSFRKAHPTLNYYNLSKD